MLALPGCWHTLALPSLVHGAVPLSVYAAGASATAAVAPVAAIIDVIEDFSSMTTPVIAARDAGSAVTTPVGSSVPHTSPVDVLNTQISGPANGATPRCRAECTLSPDALAELGVREI